MVDDVFRFILTGSSSKTMASFKGLNVFNSSISILTTFNPVFPWTKNSKYYLEKINVDDYMDKRTQVEKIDKKMQEQGWKFFGPILHYEKAWKDHAAIYERDGKYVVSGLDFSGEKELHEPIEKKEAIKRSEESLEEIKKYILGL